MPEMIVSFVAAAEGNIDISIGNAIGSVTVNTGFIMALSVVFMPAVIKRREIAVKAVVMLGSTLLIMLFGFSGSLGNLPCAILFCGFVIFMADNIISAVQISRREKPNRAAEAIGSGGSVAANVVKFIAGAICIAVGSKLLVDNASVLAESLGVSQRIIAVTIIAIGTSLPELITALTSIIKKQSDLSVGNVIGANIVNLALVQPLSKLIAGRPLPVSEGFIRVDIPVCLLIGCVALIPALVKGKMYKKQGAAMIGIYLVYLVVTIFLVA